MAERPKLLIVDDDFFVRRLLALHLRKLNYEIFEAGTGEEAMNLLEGHTFDVALLDLILPYYGGFTLCQKMKEKGSPAPYVMIITGEDSEETKATAMECGADEFLRKPFSADDVVQRIELLASSRR
ncbi:MAG: response regulator, partial [Acidobacteriota bacterium]